MTMPVGGHTRLFNLTGPCLWIPGISAANTALTVTVPAQVPGSAANQLQTVIPAVVASCPSGTPAATTLTITDGTSTYETDVELTVATPLAVPLPYAFGVQLGQAATVTLGAAGSGVAAKLNVGFIYL